VIEFDLNRARSDGVSATETVIKTENLRKRYGDLWAVDGVDLDIKRGECFAMLGPNGAGKTTTTEMLAGFRKPTSGEVHVLGSVPIKAGATWHSRVGIVLQSVSDLSELTVTEAVNHFAGYYANPRNVDEVIDAVGLTEKRSDRNGKLSGGQRRRLDVALGIIGRPELLFLDEPTTGFDPEARRQFWALIDTLKAEGTTILLTTHYLEEAEYLADRVGVIAKGKVVACDTPEDLGDRQEGAAHVTWLEDGQTRREYTDMPTKVVSELSARFDGEIPELVVARPSLEDVYLKMIGHSELLEG
jgi:ABC-2 type transport system ATP-binding protein